MNNLEFAQQWNEHMNQHVEYWHECLLTMKSICHKYLESKKNIQEVKHNVFQMVSDKYYRENFHSDIIQYFLDPRGIHDCGDLFLKTFISMLNKKGGDISFSNYQDASVVREQGRVDVLIFSKKCKRAIIIENKINNAGDMERQLPRYYDELSKNNTIDAIVYVPPDINKMPDTSTWTNEDKIHVKEPLLQIIPAFGDASVVNIVSDWIEPSISELQTKDADVASTLRQYSHLIKTLNKNYMDTIIFEKFYNELVQDDNLYSAISIRNMLDELPHYLALRIKNKFENRCHPFDGIWLYNKDCVVFEGSHICGMYMKLHVNCSVDGYNIELVLWNDDTHLTDYHHLVRRMVSLKEFENNASNERCYYKKIAFKEEAVVNKLRSIDIYD